MDKEQLEKEIESLKSQRDQAIANVNAITGALQFAQAMLSRMDPPVDEIAAKRDKE